VAGATGGGLGVAAHGDDAGGWEGVGAGGAGGGEGAGEHVEGVAAVEVEVAGAGGVGVHEIAAEGYSEGVGAFFAGFGVGGRRGGGWRCRWVLCSGRILW